MSDKPAEGQTGAAGQQAGGDYLNLKVKSQVIYSIFDDRNV